MDQIEKLLNKIALEDKIRLLATARLIEAGNLQNLDIKKLKNSNFFRARKGQYRIIFHFNNETQKFVIDAIKLRNENTYK